MTLNLEVDVHVVWWFDGFQVVYLHAYFVRISLVGFAPVPLVFVLTDNGLIGVNVADLNCGIHVAVGFL